MPLPTLDQAKPNPSPLGPQTPTLTIPQQQVGQLLQTERKERRSHGGNFISRTAAERSEKSTFNKFKQMVYLLESDYDKFRAAKVKDKGGCWGWGVVGFV